MYLAVHVECDADRVTEVVRVGERVQKSLQGSWPGLRDDAD